MKKLTVVTYLHQNETQFARCVQGINRQTYNDFEWLILTHKPLDVQIACVHRVVILPQHIVLKSDVLNFILPQIRTKYIAYNDSDDKSFPARFEQQVAFMEAHPEVDVCSAMFVVNETDNTWPLNETHDMIAAYLLINSPMANPAIILRNKPNFWGQTVKYNPKYVRAQDYGFWLTCLKNGLQFYNLQTPLVSYFVSDNPKHDDSQEQFAIEIRNEIHQYAGLKIPNNLNETYNNFCKLRQIEEEELNSLLAYLYQQKYNKPFQSARQAFAWQLKLYIKTYNHIENPFYTNWVEKLEKKNLWKKLFG
jgi:hypothetical protein